jgi:hypothetical protein
LLLNARQRKRGSTMIAPYIPVAMCMSTGFVPQWIMNAPGS